MAAFNASAPLLPSVRIPGPSATGIAFRCPPSMAASRPPRRNSRRQTPRRQPQPQFPQSTPDVFQFFEEESDDGRPPAADDLSDDIDDTVDDGFFSRYIRRDDREELDQREDREDRDDAVDVETGEDGDTPERDEPRSRMDRHTAASAFDAVDKLFGSRPPDRTGEKDRKSQWLRDVKARAATTEERGRRDRDTVDVDAEDVVDSTRLDDFSEADVIGDQVDTNEAPRKSGFGDQRGKSKQANGFDDSRAFQSLMKIARRGPPTENQKRSTRPRQRDSPPSEKISPSRIRSEPGKKPSFSSLLGLAKQIGTRRDGKWGDEQDDTYEPIDDEMNKTIAFRSTGSKKKDGRRRQKYTAVRRTGGQSRSIMSPPVEWQPMTENQVDNVRSDSRSLRGKPRNSSLRGVIADCQECRGSGLDVCVACLGAGWIAPLATRENGIDKERLTILEDIWSLPNLVVNPEGEAQCVRCNGIGKQFCGTCEGSGSSLRKGFSMSERNEVFDMFVGTDSMSEEGPDDTIDEDEDEEEDDDELESFQLYRGSAKTFDLRRKTGAGDDGRNAADGDSVDVDDMMDVEDESAELLSTLEAMHMADIEERKTGQRQPGVRNSRMSTLRNADDDDDDDDDVDDDDDDDDDDFTVVGMRDAQESEDLDDMDDEDDLDEDEDEFAGLGNDEISEDEDVSLAGNGRDLDDDAEEDEYDDRVY